MKAFQFPKFQKFIFIILAFAVSYHDILLADSSISFYEGIKAYRNREYRDAADWFNQSAKEGDVEAMFLLGRMHYDGSSLSINYVTALMWFELAALRGLRSARNYYRGLSKKMSQNEIQEANKLAKEWNASFKK